MIERFEKIFTEILKECNSKYVVKLEGMPTITTSKEEFLDIFYSYKVLEVVVEGFGREMIPQDTVLVNPNPHLENALREIINHDVLHPSIFRLAAEVQKDKNSDLKKSAILRGAIHSGQPVKMQYLNEDNVIKIRKRTEKGEIDVILPVTGGDTSEERTKMAVSLINALQGRDIIIQEKKKDFIQIPLFGMDDLIE